MRRKLIEVSLPLEAINKASKKQKAPKGYPTSLHKYWAQRPIAACRAVLFAQLVDDPFEWLGKHFGTEKECEAERQRLYDLIERLVPWEASHDEEVLTEARYKIARSFAWANGDEPPAHDDSNAILAYLQNPDKVPSVYDPFCGGGSIPLEAQRLGLRAYGSDLNPVAVLVSKALVEIPPKFAGRPPVNPKAQAEIGRSGGWHAKGAEGLADDVRHYGQWMRNEAEKRIGHLYPKVSIPDGPKDRSGTQPTKEATVVAWLWARTVRSPDPAAKGAMVPLVSSFMLSTKEGRKSWVEPIIDPAAPDGWRFEVKTGKLSKAEEEEKKKGTKRGRGTNFACILTGSSIEPDHVRDEGNNHRLGSRLMAIVAEGTRERVYLTPVNDQEQRAAEAAPEGTSALQVEMPDNPRWFSPPGYGMKRYVDIFTPRQLVALTTFSDLVGEARAKVLADARAAGLTDPPGDVDDPQSAVRLHVGGTGAAAYADAVATYLAFCVDRSAEYGSTLATWLTDDNAVRGTFGRQALPMTWDFCEASAFGESSGGWTKITSVIANVIDLLDASTEAEIFQIDAPKNNYPHSPSIMATDPPYYDNIGYADLSDYFYIWLRRSIAEIWPHLFRRLTTPKFEELVATPYRHGGKKEADQFFMEGMQLSFSAIADAAADGLPLTIYYAYKQSEVASDGDAMSSGWASFLQALTDSGFLVDGTWPLRTESGGRLVGRGANALASSIVLVCRKRPESAISIDRAAFVSALRRELPDAIARIRAAGVGPVDMQQSVIGPGMGVFTRFVEVLEDDDSVMPVKTALAIINRVWEELDNELVATLDPETQVALAWFGSYGFDVKPSGELITMANAKNTSIDALFGSGVFQNLHGRTALTPREKLPEGWRPSRDGRLTVWECVQHTARVLNAEDGGHEAAGRLVAEMGPLATGARALLDRLFRIATDKGWAAEARVYNGLAGEWTHLLDRVGTSGPVRLEAAEPDLFDRMRP